MQSTLYYIHDPMCSWCWGFTNTLKALLNHLPGEIEVKRLLGGLAADSDLPMPQGMQQQIKNNWQRIEDKIPGVKFNFDFWTKNIPRRSTYPACRAVIAARKQGQQYDVLMTKEIQQAYYRQAQNPSDKETLISLAKKLGLDRQRFVDDFESKQTNDELMAEIDHAREMFVESYPSLVLECNDEFHTIPIDYNSYETILCEINKYCKRIGTAI